MINSATDLLNEVLGKPGQPNVSATILHLRSGQISERKNELRKEFAVHYNCIQAWFLRCSWLKKLETLTQMLNKISSLESLEVILNTLKISCSKPTVYAKTQYSTNFVYDKTLNDHDRSLYASALKSTREQDLQWYSTLADSEQILVLIGLVRLSGGSILHNVYERGVKIYDERVKNIKPPTTHTTEKSITPEQIKPDKTKGYSTLSFSNVHSLHKLFNINPDYESEYKKLYPNDEYIIDMENKRKVWQDTITKYEIQVRGKQSGPRTKSEKKKKSKSKKKEKSKSKKKEKSKSKNKSKSSNNKEEIDMIQCLPIWTVKQIFSYLDPNTLDRIKSVNKYWKYVVNDLQKEQKTRRDLDKNLEKLKENLADIEQPTNINIEICKPEESTNNTIIKKTMLRLSERGATLPELKGKLKRPVISRPLGADAATQSINSYILPVSNLKTFPRDMCKAAPLYKRPSCIVNELGFNKVIAAEKNDDTLSIAGTYLNETMWFTSRMDEDDTFLMEPSDTEIEK